MPMTSCFHLAAARALMLQEVMLAQAQVRSGLNRSLQLSLLLTCQTTNAARGGQSAGH